VLWLAFSILSLIMLNRLTSGTCARGPWSFFEIWHRELAYVARSATPLTEMRYLFVGQHSLWLWLYTVIHLAVAAILGWGLAACSAAGCFLCRCSTEKQSQE
jgi:hypothetical protein